MRTWCMLILCNILLEALPLFAEPETARPEEIAEKYSALRQEIFLLDEKKLHNQKFSKSTEAQATVTKLTKEIESFSMELLGQKELSAKDLQFYSELIKQCMDALKDFSEDEPG